MGFGLEFRDKYRLWSELLHSSTDRVFVATEQREQLGARVPVELSIRGTRVRIVLLGTVVGLRAPGGRFPGGVFLHFDREETEKCRRFLGLSLPGGFEKGRRHPRVRCALELAFVNRPEEARYEVRNLSESGLLCTAPSSLSASERVQLLLTLDSHEQVPAEAEVSWVRPRDRLAGLRFVGLPSQSHRAILDAVARLGAAENRGRHGRPSLVIAEDDAEILAFLTRALDRHGYEVQTARRGDEALALVRELYPEMVLMDILMPGMDGVDICKLMRADAEMAEIPVVFFSALEEDRLKEMAHDAGATDYLCKPVNLADLLNVVGQYLKK